METLSYIANPSDSRCKWWSVKIPAAFAIADLNDKTSLRALGFLRRGGDIELEEGDAVLDSEEMHHCKYLGYRVLIGIAAGGELRWIRPNAVIKNAIKQWATPERWERLRRGNGDVAACLRFFMAWQMGFRWQPTLADVAAKNLITIG